jgi:hypothetical protein
MIRSSLNDLAGADHVIRRGIIAQGMKGRVRRHLLGARQARLEACAR